MTARIPSPREVFEILALNLSFEKLKDRFPGLTDERLRGILATAAKIADGSQVPRLQPKLDVLHGAQSGNSVKPPVVHPTHKPPEGKWIAHIDGASRGNPGPASSAAFVYTHDGPLELKRAIGNETNNVAEYEALLLVLQAAIDGGIRQIEIRSDSELLVKQMKGHYKVKSQNLARLFIKAKNLEKLFKSFTILHVPREENAEADRLANEALDETVNL